MPHKLLLADDSVTIQRVIELTFADEDVHVVAVGDGKKAIASIESDRPDIVLADVGMPERDGYDVAAFVKGNPRFADIPGVDDQVGIAQRGARLCSEQAVGVRDDPDRCLAVGHHLRQRRGA